MYLAWFLGLFLAMLFSPVHMQEDPSLQMEGEDQGIIDPRATR